jgi:hypothetical protein
LAKPFVSSQLRALVTGLLFPGKSGLRGDLVVDAKLHA